MGSPDQVSSNNMQTLIFQILIVNEWERFLIWALQPVLQPVSLSAHVIRTANVLFSMKLEKGYNAAHHREIFAYISCHGAPLKIMLLRMK